MFRLMRFRKVLFFRQNFIQKASVKQLAAKDHSSDFLRIVYIVERIGVEQNEVGNFALFDGALRLQLA